jgi:hypothetical protein
MSKEQLSTLGKEIPKHKNALEEKYQTTESHVKRLDQDNIQSMVDQLPEPSGWRMLVLPFTPKEKTKGGIIFSQESLDKARIATNCGYVIKMGPLAYGDKEKVSNRSLVQKRRLGYLCQICWFKITNRRRRSPSLKRR